MMTTDEVLEMAIKAGFREHDFPFKKFKFEAFAKLVRDDYSFTHAQLWLKRIDEAVKAERNACIALIKSHGPTLANGFMLTEAIRARGEPTLRGEA